MSVPSPLPLAGRAARVVRDRPLSEVWRIARRETGYIAAGRRIAAELSLAARRGRPIILGPFLGEVGFELLYWLPLVRRELARHRVPPGRVTVLSRGGAGLWYRDVAEHEIDAYDLMAPDELAGRLVERRAEAGDLKQLTVEPLDRELLTRARQLTGRDAVGVHPALMYTRLRGLYSGWTARDEFVRAASGRIAAPGAPPPGLPRRFVALKAYFSASFPDRPANRAFLADLVTELAKQRDIVVLTSGRRLDDHVEWEPPPGPRVHLLSAVEPRENLAVQTRVVAASERLVATYGGFSYLGPMLEVPTTAFLSDAVFNPVHLAVLRESAGPLDLVHAQGHSAARRAAASG